MKFLGYGYGAEFFYGSKFIPSQFDERVCGYYDIIGYDCSVPSLVAGRRQFKNEARNRMNSDEIESCCASMW
jgi:hypothetical protein